MRTGRFDAAVRALRTAIRVLGSTPTREAALGQALVMEADGVVTGEARHVFDVALKGDPAMPQARFFEGLAAVQDGDKTKARAIWTALVAEAPPDAPYTAIIRQRLAALDGVAVPEPAMAAQPDAMQQSGWRCKPVPLPKPVLLLSALHRRRWAACRPGPERSRRFHPNSVSSPFVAWWMDWRRAWHRTGRTRKAGCGSFGPTRSSARPTRRNGL